MDILLLCNVPMTSHTLYLTNQILKFCNLSYNDLSDVTKIPEKHRFYFPDAGTLARFEGFVWTKERSWLWSSTCINYQPKYLRTFSISVSCFSKGRKTLWNNTVDRQTGVKDLRNLNLTAGHLLLIPLGYTMQTLERLTWVSLPFRYQHIFAWHYFSKKLLKQHQSVNMTIWY